MAKPWVAGKVARAPGLSRQGGNIPGRLDPRSIGAVCAGCPFSKNGQPFRQVLGEFPAADRIQGLLVGETPGREESELGRPFAGGTGKELDDALHSVGLDRWRMGVVNATCCVPPSNKTEPMMRKAVAHCRGALLHQLQAVPEGTPVLALGKWAYVALTGKDKGVMNARGFLRGGFQIPRPETRTLEEAHAVIAAGLEPQPLRIGSRTPPRPAAGTSTLMVTWHPTFAIFYNPYEWAAFLIDLDRFKRLIIGKLRPGPRVLLIHPTARDVHQLTGEALQPGGFVSVDIETGPDRRDRPWTGKDPMRAVLRTLGLGGPEWGLSFMWEGASESLLKPVRKLLADPTIIKVFQNGFFFDLPVMRRYGLEVK